MFKCIVSLAVEILPADCTTAVMPTRTVQSRNRKLLREANILRNENYENQYTNGTKTNG